MQSRPARAYGRPDPENNRFPHISHAVMGKGRPGAAKRLKNPKSKYYIYKGVILVWLH